jgi:hypothetical protein
VYTPSLALKTVIQARLGRQIFDGRYMLSDHDLTLNGTWDNLGGVGVQLRRRIR